MKTFKDIPFDKFFYNESYFFVKDQILFQFKKGKTVEFYMQQEYFIIETINDGVIWIRDKQKLCSIDINTKKTHTTPLLFQNSIQVKHLTPDFVIIRSSTSDQTWDLSKINLSGQAKWCINYNSTFKSILTAKNLILSCTDKGKLECLNLKDGNLIWQLEFAELLNEEKIIISDQIIEKNGILYFILHGTQQHICFGVEAASGKVVKQYKEVIGDLFTEHEFIYFLHQDQLQTLNTITDHIYKWEIENLMNKEGIGSLRSPVWEVANKSVYFSQAAAADKHSGIKGAQYGILNPFKKELIHKGKLAQEHGIIGDIKVSTKHLYLHTQDQRLFVFEKES